MRNAYLPLLLGLGPGAALGVGRFGYALVLPAMQVGLDLGFAQLGLLGSANTGGYLIGALISHRVLERLGYRRGFALSLLIQTATLAALAVTAWFPALMALRFIQGALGAFVFVGGAAMLLAGGGRGMATGIYFGGVGSGILLSPLVLPLMSGWRSGWVGLAVVSLAMSLVALRALSGLSEPPTRPKGERDDLSPIRWILVAYGLYGAGYIGYMTFVTTGLGVPLGPFWALLGLGALLTGLLWGRVVDAIRGHAALPWVLFTLAVSSAYPLLLWSPWVSGFVFGLSFLGVITAITDVFRSTLPPASWGWAMGLSTAAFALGQAVGPTISGVAGDLFGGPPGALGAATILLVASWLLALRASRARERSPAHS